MNSKNELSKAYKLLIPITNSLLFNQTKLPKENENGYTLSDNFIDSLIDHKKNESILIRRVINLIASFIFDYSLEEKKDLIRVFIDNEIIVKITYLLSNQHSKMDINQFILKIISDYRDKNMSLELVEAINYNFHFIYEMKFDDGYISVKQYNNIITRITQKATIL